MGAVAADRSDPLWVPVIAPVIWAVHFMICYSYAAMACGRFGGGPSTRGVIVGATSIAVAMMLALLWRGLRRLRYRVPVHPIDEDTPEDRNEFMAFTTVLLAGLSLVAAGYVALAALAIEGCGA